MKEVIDLSTRITQIGQRVSALDDLKIIGRLTRIIGLTLEGVGCAMPLGSHCFIQSDKQSPIEAEVIGFDGDKTYFMATDPTEGLTPGAMIIPTHKSADVAVGQNIIGRVLDGSGSPLDSIAPPVTQKVMKLCGTPINPLARACISEPLDVGVRAINALLPIGRGQRMGLFAGSGVGKSMLLGMMTRFTQADVCVVGLIGERGREVKEFIETILGEAGLQRSVVIASPSDTPPLMRLHGAMRATAIAEYFRDQGKHVLLIIDSLTRFAHAQREIGLSIGEPPTTKGYPPSVFTKLSQLVERAGNAKDGAGSVTAFYTVLSEGDDHNDPIADAARSFLDGHVVLSRTLADSGHYPAIDIEASVSRVVQAITDSSHRKAMKRFLQLHAVYESNKELINLGAYQRGADPDIDLAIAHRATFIDFLQQDVQTAVSVAQSIAQLSTLMENLDGE